ncbi:glycerol-3-phosphate acyltransferase [Chloroflexota bacterium]
MTIQFISLALSAYLLGSVPTAYLIARWRRGIDIRQYGSGNVGASNVLASVSKRWTIPVAVFDIGKGALTVWIAQLLGFGAAEQITVGIITVIGHNWPIFLRFQGGRGISTTLGVITMLSWKLGLIALVISYMLAPLRQLSLGVCVALTSLPIFGWFLSQPLDIEARLPVTLGFAVLALIGLSKRLLAPKTAISESVPPLQLFFNRILFDRDISDRKAWISRTPPEVSLIEQPLGQEEEQGESL